jgi:hypothetical protein
MLGRPLPEELLAQEKAKIEAALSESGERMSGPSGCRQARIYPRVEDQIAEDQQESLQTTDPSVNPFRYFLSKPQNARCEIRKFRKNRNFRFCIKLWTFNNLELAQ